MTIKKVKKQSKANTPLFRMILRRRRRRRKREEMEEIHEVEDDGVC